MKTQTPFKRLILRAVLRKVSPIVIRVLAVPDYLDLASFDEVFRTVLGWDGLGFSFHIHGQEFTSFLRTGARFIGQPCGIFNYSPGRHFSIPAVASMIGNGSSGFSIPRWEVPATTSRCVWRVAVPLRPSSAAAPRVTG
jgi:hypothetical protein